MLLHRYFLKKVLFLKVIKSSKFVPDFGNVIFACHVADFGEKIIWP